MLLLVLIVVLSDSLSGDAVPVASQPPPPQAQVLPPVASQPAPPPASTGPGCPADPDFPDCTDSMTVKNLTSISIAIGNTIDICYCDILLGTSGRPISSSFPCPLLLLSCPPLGLAPTSCLSALMLSIPRAGGTPPGTGPNTLAPKDFAAVAAL